MCVHFTPMVSHLLCLTYIGKEGNSVCKVSLCTKGCAIDCMPMRKYFVVGSCVASAERRIWMDGKTR